MCEKDALQDAFDMQTQHYQASELNVTIRREMGRDIDGACGQLRNKYMEDVDESNGDY